MLLSGITNAWIHIMAVAVAIGGSFFMNFVLNKGRKVLPAADIGKFNSVIGEAFGQVVWMMTVLILITGLIRMFGLELFSSSVLLETYYGNLLLAKLVLFTIIVINTATITRTSLAMKKMAAAGGPPPVDFMSAGQKRVKTLGMANLILASVVVALSVAMRFIG